MLTTIGEQTIAAAMGGVASTLPTHIAIGTGSITIVSGAAALNTETDRNALSSSDTSIAKDVTYIADFGSVKLSGTTFTEFGLFNASSAGSMYMTEVVTADSFEGDRELQIQTTLRFARSGL